MVSIVVFKGLMARGFVGVTLVGVYILSGLVAILFFWEVGGY